MTSPSLHDIGQRVKQARWNKKWSMKQLAEHANIKDVTTIGYIENGATRVSDTTLEQIAKALDTTLDYIKTGIQSEPTLISKKQLQQLMNHFPVKPENTIWYKDLSTGNIIPFTVKDYVCEVKCVNEATGVHITFDIRNLGKNLFLSKKEAENTPEKL